MDKRLVETYKYVLIEIIFTQPQRMPGKVKDEHGNVIDTIITREIEQRRVGTIIALSTMKAVLLLNETDDNDMEIDIPFKKIKEINQLKIL